MKLKQYLWHLSGNDHRIIVHCETHLQQGFLLLGLSVLLFGLLSAVSSYLVFIQLFSNKQLSFLLAVFFTWMFSNLYRLMLYSAGRDPLPQSKDKVNTVPTWTLRILSICFMTLLVAKPLECTLYKSYLDVDILVYKIKLRQNSLKKIKHYYTAQIQEVKQISIDPVYQTVFINHKEQAARSAMETADNRLEKCSFFMQRLRFLINRHPSCWYLTSALALFFFCPLLIRYELRSCAYEEQRAIGECRNVRLNYYAFYKKYTAMFLNEHKQRVDVHAAFTDAPYNTTRKVDKRQFLKEKQFLAEFYHA